MQSLDPDVGLPGREALGPDPTLGGVVPLPGGLAVPKLVEDPPQSSLAGRRTPAPGGVREVGVGGARACELHLFRSRGSGNRISRPENTPRRKPLSGPSLGSDADSLAAEIRLRWLPGVLPGYDRVGCPRWRVTFRVGSTPTPGTLESRSPTRGQGMLKASSRSCSGMAGGRWVRSGFLPSRRI